MRYWPAPSLTLVRTFSISAGLDASILTPGSTAPDVSRTTPAIDWAAARAGITTTAAAARSNRRPVALTPRWKLCILPPSLQHGHGATNQPHANTRLVKCHHFTETPGEILQRVAEQCSFPAGHDRQA